MALSNWDTMAFGSDGKSCEGSFTNPKNKAHIDIYKNWAYLRSPAKNPETDYQYTGDTIAQIDSGEISILGFRISAIRHKDQDAIFLYAEYTEDRGENTPVDQKRFVNHRFGGIGCYGFHDNSSEWIGVKPETLEAFFQWLEGREHRDAFTEGYFVWIEACRASEKLRYNQGDAFFATNLNLELPATEVGKAETPFLLQALNKKED